jgi:hypothetical protein
MIRYALLMLAAALCLPGCPDSQDADGASGAADASPQDAAEAEAEASDGSANQGRIDIYLAGDPTAKTFTDGLSGQTPRDFKIALSKYYVMKSADDPAPTLCFDLGVSEVVADLSGDTLVGTCATASIPTGVYTHGRVRVQWAQYTVGGVLHYQGYTMPGDFTLFRAYSDTVRGGVPMSAGQGVVHFSGTNTETAVTYPPLSAGPDLTVETVNGECWMTFAYTHPLPIDQTNTGSHWARFHWEIFEGFRWSDGSLPGFAPGAWDVSAAEGETETVIGPGTTGYHTTSSVD